MIEFVLLILIIFVCYLILCFISHYESGMFGGSLVPSWLCIFCLIDKIKEEK